MLAFEKAFVARSDCVIPPDDFTHATHSNHPTGFHALWGPFYRRPFLIVTIFANPVVVFFCF